MNNNSFPKKFLRIGVVPTALIVACLAFPTHTAEASGVPTFPAAQILQDGVHHVETMLQYQQQLEQMASSYEQQLNEVREAIETKDALTGIRTLGDLLNDAAAQDLRRALPADLHDMLGIGDASGLGAAASQTKITFDELMEQYDPISAAELMPSADDNDLTQEYDQQTKAVYSSMAASQTAYNSASRKLDNYETLLSELNTTTDLKASVDLLSRITVENGILMNEMFKMQALRMNMDAREDSAAISENRRDFNAMQYDADLAADMVDFEKLTSGDHAL